MQRNKDVNLIWNTAIGLQDVDGLKVSDYLLELRDKHIDGKINIDEVINHLIEKRASEADLVSACIVKVLLDDTFYFSKNYFLEIHYQLFKHIYKHAGKVRQSDIAKMEPFLNGDSVDYGCYHICSPTIDFDIAKEKNYKYTDKNETEHIADFISGIWQNHPFNEGNTRACAVFLIKYLDSMGFELSDTFYRNSKFFRGALAKACYIDLDNNIWSDWEPLKKFIDNLVYKGSHKLLLEDLKL